MGILIEMVKIREIQEIKAASFAFFFKVWLALTKSVFFHMELRTFFFQEATFLCISGNLISNVSYLQQLD